MKIKYMFFVILILNFACNSKSKGALDTSESQKAQAYDSNNEINKDFEKNYIGTINKKWNVIFHLKSINGEIKGFYFYQNKGIDIILKGKILNNKIVLDEFDFLNNKVAQINIETKGQNVFGEWINSKTNKQFKIELQEIKKEIIDLPKNIEGTYSSNESETGDCNLTLTLTKKNGEYYYDFKSDSRKLNGKVSFYRSFKKNDTFITLEGIEWAEYSGNIEDPDDENHEDLDLPIGIEGTFIENEIRIQNTGNVMNYYVKLDDCGEKYIELRK